MLLALFHRIGRTSALLEWRIAAFFLSAVLGLAGVFLENSWLVTGALIVLMGGLALRAFTARDSDSDEVESTEQEPAVRDQEPTLHDQEPTIRE